MPQDISSIQGGIVVVVVVVVVVVEVVVVEVVVVAVVVVTVVVVVEVVVVDVVVVVGTVGFVAGVVAGGLIQSNMFVDFEDKYLVDPGIGRSPQSTVQGQLQMWLTSSNNVPGPQHLRSRT